MTKIITRAEHNGVVWRTVCRVSGIFNRVLSGFVAREERVFLRIYSTVREYGTNNIAYENKKQNEATQRQRTIDQYFM